MLIGFEMPNVPVPDLSTWQQVDELRSTIVKARPYHLSISTLEHIRQRKLAVILRPNADEGATFDVQGRTVELRDAIAAVQPYATAIYCVVDNEPNHVSNHAAPSADYWTRCRAVFETLAQEYPEVEYVSPPLAVAQGEADWYATGQEVIALFDYVGVHLYGQTDNSLVTYSLDLARQFNKPIIADELGNTDHHLSPDNKAFMVASFARQAAEAGVVAATIFIATTPTPEWDYCTLPTHKLGMIADAVASVTNASSVPSVTPEPVEVTPLSLADRVLASWPGPITTPAKPLVWDQWPDLVYRAAQIQPHLQPDELAMVALGPLATLDQESDGVIRADGDLRNGYYCSRGLFQLNTCGGAGSAMMAKHGLTDPAALYDLRYQYEHAERLLLAAEAELYWARKEGRAYWPGRAMQAVQRSSSDPSGSGYQEAYRRLAGELGLEVQSMGKTIRIGNLDVIDVQDRYPSTYPSRDLSQITNIGVHHSVTPTLPDTASEAEEIAQLDGIHAYHLKEFGGISYPLVVCPSGRIYMTGSWNTIRALVGGQGNVHTLGLLMLGTFMDTVPGTKQIEGARTLIPNVRYQLGNGGLPVVGHKEIASAPTACPGDTWEIWRPWLTDAPTPADTRSALHIQIDALYAYIDQLGDHPLAVPMRAALLAAKDAAGIA